MRALSSTRSAPASGRPREELESSLAAIHDSDLNCFSFLDPERALDAAERADVSLPFGGLPVGIKELEPVAGWPQTEASLVFKDRIATDTSTIVERLLGIGGAVPVGLTTASEFGGLNVSVTKLNGVTHNPWRHGRTTGGSSAGSAAAVAGGLVPLATGGDGGGSIRIPAGYTGLLGMKGTYGRIPRGPHAYFTPGTIVLGCLARSVRDAARYFDVCGGYDSRDPWSLPKRTNWEANLGTNDLRGKRVGIVANLGGVTLEPGVEENLRNSAKQLIANTEMIEVDLDITLPNLAAQWMMGNLATLLADLGARWPKCASELTDEMTVGLLLSQSMYNLHTASVAEGRRIQANHAMADAFDKVDFVIAATNPGPTFAANAPMSNPTSSFVDSVKASKAAHLGFRGIMGGVRLAGAAVAEDAVGGHGSRVGEVPRPRAHGRAHDHLQHLRQPRGVDPERVRRRPPRRHASAHPPPRRRTALRRRPRRRTREPVAARGVDLLGEHVGRDRPRRELHEPRTFVGSLRQLPLRQ